MKSGALSEFFLFTYNTFLVGVNPSIRWCARGTAIFIAYNCQTFLPYTTAFSTPLSTSIRCGSRGWRGCHGLKLINKATTYNTFSDESNPPIRWCSRLTAVFGTCNCQTFLSLISFYLQHALYVL